MKKFLILAILSLLVACGEEAESAPEETTAAPKTEVSTPSDSASNSDINNNDMDKEAICALEKKLDAAQSESKLVAALSGTKYSVEKDVKYTWKHSGCTFSVGLDKDGGLTSLSRHCFNSTLPADLEMKIDEAKTKNDLVNSLGEPTKNVKGNVYRINFQNAEFKKSFNVDTEGSINGRLTSGSIGCAE